jgi:septin family protein
MVFVGEKGSGKSTLIAKMLAENVKEEMVTTTALEFKSGTKTREDRTVKLNIYELGGGRVLSNLLKTVFVGNSIDHMCIVLCIDLSKPGNAIDNLMFWQKAIREQSMEVVAQMKDTDPQSLLGI